MTPETETSCKITLTQQAKLAYGYIRQSSRNLEALADRDQIVAFDYHIGRGDGVILAPGMVARSLIGCLGTGEDKTSRQRQDRER